MHTKASPTLPTFAGLSLWHVGLSVAAVYIRLAVCIEGFAESARD